MSQYGVGAILAALYSQQILYGSRGRRRTLRYAACIKLNEWQFGTGTKGPFLCFMIGVLGEGLDRSNRRARRQGISSSSNINNSIAECFNSQVKQICKELLARPSIPRLSVSPFPHIACVTANFAAEMRSGDTAVTSGDSCDFTAGGGTMRGNNTTNLGGSGNSCGFPRGGTTSRARYPRLLNVISIECSTQLWLHGWSCIESRRCAVLASGIEGQSILHQ